jgi:hypothetical protein
VAFDGVVTLAQEWGVDNGQDGVTVVQEREGDGA